jgi:hypothetical protein
VGNSLAQKQCMEFQSFAKQRPQPCLYCHLMPLPSVGNLPVSTGSTWNQSLKLFEIIESNSGRANRFKRIIWDCLIKYAFFMKYIYSYLYQAVICCEGTGDMVLCLILVLIIFLFTTIFRIVLGSIKFSMSTERSVPHISQCIFVFCISIQILTSFTLFKLFTCLNCSLALWFHN